jgi:hypothetical protein
MLLTIPTAINLYFAASTVCLRVFHGCDANDGFAEFGLAAMIVVISVPLSILLTIGLIAWIAARIAVPNARFEAIARIPLILIVLNILTPALLLYALRH